MKSRNFFVSNSSSSSFVVRRVDNFSPMREQLTTPEQDKLLEDYGFRKGIFRFPSQIPNFNDREAWCEQDSNVRELEKENDFFVYSYGFEVTCNHDDVLVFLVRNRIPFIASCHYGHETVVFPPKSEFVYFGRNFGAEMETYGVRGTEEGDWKPPTEPGIERFTVKEFVEKFSYLLIGR